MRIEEIYIHNYKSLREVTIRPGNLNCFVGPNGAGKSNVFEALSFLSDVYNEGLEKALLSKGGINSFLYNGIDLDVKILSFGIKVNLSNSGDDSKTVRLEHFFSIIPTDDNINFIYEVNKEIIRISYNSKYLVIIERNNIEITHQFIDSTNELFISKSNPLSKIIEQFTKTFLSKTANVYFFNDNASFFKDSLLLSPTNTRIASQDSIFYNLKFKYYNLSAHISRMPSSPSTIHELNQDGSQLGISIHRLKKQSPEKWENILEIVTDIVPGLKNISIATTTHNNQIRVEFEFENLRNALQTSDVSDGTILLLSTLIAIVGTNAIIVCIDEPENSLHPWGIDILMRHINDIVEREQKTIFIATQNARVLDCFSPEDTFCVYMQNNKTNLIKLSSLSPVVFEEWEVGNINTSDVFTTGLIPELVPNFMNKKPE